MVAGRENGPDECLGEAPSLSERLLAVLTREMASLEAAIQEIKPISGDAGGGRAADAGAQAVLAGAKGRIEAVGQMTRTLEKLLELRRLEALEARGDGDGDGEAVRLREEMLTRLKALDARRKGGATLFSAGGSFAGLVGKDEGGGVLDAVGCADRVATESA